MIALVGQSVVDRVKLPGRAWVERLGGAPFFGAAGLRLAGRPAVILTRGATPVLRAPLHDLGFPVIEGPSTGSCVSEMVLSPDGGCLDSFEHFGDPFTPADVHGWMAPGLTDASAIVCGAQWRDDFGEATLATLAQTGRPVYLDGQGPLRLPRLGPLHLAGPLPHSLLRHVTVLKLAEEEAHVALGGVDAAAARKLGVPVVVVTLGARGAVLFVDGRAIDVPVEPVWNLADSVGAGDAFLALMASAGADGATPGQAARFACDATAALLRARVAEAPEGSGSPHTVAAGSHGDHASRRVLLFDFGGTLDADGIPWKARVFRLFREEGLVAGADVFDPAFYAADDALTGAVPPTLSFEATVNELCQGVARRLEPAVTNGTAGRVAARFLADCHGQLRANGPLLGRLAGRYRLGVVSNFYGNLARVCEDTGIARYFDVLVDSACVGHRKPEPAIFRHALDALGVGPEAALFVGDSLHRDMAGARGVGIPHIWLTPGVSDRPPDDVCCPGDRAVRSLQELEGLVL